jgi:hypothetical protein
MSDDTDLREFIATLPEADRRRLREVGTEMVVSILTHAVLDGALVIEGKTDDEIRQRIDEVVSAHLEAYDRPYGFIVNHLDSLLSGARRAFEAGDRGQSLILYATWAEHWINGLVQTRMESLRHPYETTRSVIRDVRFEGKLTWLVAVLGLPPIPEEARRALVRLAGDRNEFVHYKWPPLQEDGQLAIRRKHEETIAAVESYIGMLLEYEANAVEDDARGKIRRLLEHLG